ncbi:MAG: TolC family protein [Muribaculaceae bacterium]|nr:TolC family protein [Muribaculaceae bacterium]
MKTKYNIIVCILVTAVAALVSCSPVSKLRQPDLQDMPQTFAKGEADSTTIADLTKWQFYADTTLTSLIERALDRNRDVAIAAAHMRELEKLYGVDKLNYLPDLNANFGALRETNHYYGQAFKPDTEVSLKATLSWEADLWGGLSWKQKQSKEKFLGAAEEYRAMQMTIVSQVATAYINLVALDSELAVVRNAVETRAESLEKAKLRYEGGLTSEVVYQQALVEYSTAAAMIPNLENRITMAENALNILTGDFPGREILRHNVSLDLNLPERVPVGVPSMMLEKRPDIRAAEHNLKAAAAAVGVAYANRFPSFRISLTGGAENEQLAHLLESPFSYMLGNLAGTVFDWGKKKRAYEAKIEAYEQARLAYEQRVMSAFAEVDNAISAYRSALSAVERRTDLRDAASRYLQLANLQYRGGSLNYLDVLDAQRRYLDSEIALTNSVRDEYLALVMLYRALGGW